MAMETAQEIATATAELRWHASRTVSGSYNLMKHESPHSRQQALVSRARRAVSRGEKRQAMVALREACLLAEGDACLWALYANACARANRVADAERAYSQALYLRQREHDTLRARSLRDILDRLRIERAA